MPVILPSEKRQLRSRLVYFALYASLALGPLSMVIFVDGVWFV